MDKTVLIVLLRLVADYEVIEVILMIKGKTFHLAAKGKNNFKYLQFPRSQNTET